MSDEVYIDLAIAIAMHAGHDPREIPDYPWRALELLVATYIPPTLGGGGIDGGV